MRVVIATILILSIFVVSTIMLSRYIDNSCEELLGSIKGIHTLVENSNWDDARKQFSNFQKELDNTKKRWQLFLEHYEMDAIDITIARLGQYVDIEERALSLGEVAELELLINHIKDKERLKLVNIL